MKLVLFDIDGTLIDSGGAGRRSLNKAMKDLFFIDSAFRDIDLAGKTDILIIKEGLSKYNISIDDNINPVIGIYFKYLTEEIQNNRKRIMPGIRELLDKIKLVKNTATGLLTGNLEKGARIKLEPFGLNVYFKSGAFGSDNENRNNLVPIAVRRFETIYDIKIEYQDCIVVGDTPKDIECAKIHNAFSFCVATGLFSSDELARGGADYVVEDLSDPEPFLQFI